MAIGQLVERHRRRMERQAWSDLGRFCAFLESSGQLKAVDCPVAPRLEITALCHRALSRAGPALRFVMPEGHSMPVLGNLFGHQSRILAALELSSPAELRRLGEELAALRFPRLPDSVHAALEAAPGFARLADVTPRRCDAAPWQEIVAEGREVDLSRLPVTTCWPGDAGPLISFGIVITQSPVKQRTNLGIYRQQLIDRNKVIMRWLPHRGGAQDFREFQQRHPARPYPLAVVIGADPATLLAAVTPIPDTLSEFQFAGLLRGRRSRIVRSSLTGLPIPHGAEIVLEGHIHAGETASEGPFADHTGYYNAVAEFPVFTIERVSHRANPVYLTSYLGKPAEDEASVMAMSLNDVFVPLLQAQFPEVVDFYLPPEACSYRMALVSIRKNYEGHARQIMFGIWSWLRQFTYTKTIVVTDDDIDIRNWKDVVWAISTRADPVRDTVLVDNTPIDYLDFASPRPGLGGKMGIDATNKFGSETDRTWGRVARADAATLRRVEQLAEALDL